MLLLNERSTASQLPAALRLRVYYPRANDRAGFDWPVPQIPQNKRRRDRAEYLSARITIPASQRSLQAGASRPIRFQFSVPSQDVDKFIPAGQRTMTLLDDTRGTVYNPGDANIPVAIDLIPRSTLPASSSNAPLFTWVLR